MKKIRESVTITDKKSNSILKLCKSTSRVLGGGEWRIVYLSERAQAR